MAGRKGLAKAEKRTSRTRPTRDAREVFLEHLRKTSNVSESARVAVVGRTTVHEWRDQDPAFAAAWDDAIDEATDALEAEARRRAVDGHEEYVISMGQIVRDPETGEPLKQKKYSDALTTLLLKAHRPEKFRERYDVQQSGHITMNITPDDDAL
ncbi:cytochrome P450 [Komagataeibacter nataicola]|uniref:cytochrome P450 n=1 Tax=Komagataeibacter nataicola TaxID=265960 RepID=UPI001F3C1985|nr:cytochrome P450 [Komagataeibacter nataicola]WNM08386.1 cytochrome P450 [Komagataeibacter nataicola]GBR23096.1 hypothetical protein AA0616_2442 [Komagataeibacter nataicola NRIC 0616]